ncbi:unnamed protein product [Leptidea sinapis]|uniref:DH domain-containing protein n=1 Tax=Leptidea sinapis TaxID=189913 RepID=A0A5E4QZ76_9NEOP|nr:unnamed protein product [Leptidea sinapis]
MLQAKLEIEHVLAQFDDGGIPPLPGYERPALPEQLARLREWAAAAPEADAEPHERSKQAAVRELVLTEVDYLHHLQVLTEVFMGAALALQASNKLKFVDIQKLFSNIPDLLHASIAFWKETFNSMVADGLQNAGRFKPEMMFDGFSNLRKLLVPYETYLTDQRHITEYLRALQAEQEFTLYLNWCHAYKECNRLQFSDLLIKPMQRLTKYSLLLNRITTYCGDYEQKETLVAMDHKDEELDLIFRKFAAANIMGEVLNTRGQQIRSLTEVKVFLFSDMVLVCKKQKGGVPYRMIRPRYWLQRLSYHPRLNRATKQLCGLNFLQAWDYKIRLALATYELSVWAAHHPERSLNDIQAPRAGDPLLDSEARETVASMRRARLTGSLDGAGAAPATCRQTGYGTSGHQLSPRFNIIIICELPPTAEPIAACTRPPPAPFATLRFGRPSSPQPSSSQSPSTVKPYCLQSLPDLTFEHSFANRRNKLSMDLNLHQLFLRLKLERKNQTKEITTKLTENIDEKLQPIIEENKNLKIEINNLENNVAWLEKDRKKHNIVIFGMEEYEKSNKQLITKVIDEIKKLEIELSVQEINSAHRVGKTTADSKKARPIVITLANTWKKIEILKNKKKSKNIYITEDFSKEVLEKRRSLQAQLQ